MNEQEKHIGIWAECLHILGNIVEPQQFDTWFKPVRPVSFQGSTLTIEVPTHFYREYLEDAFLDVLKFTLKRVIGSDAKLLYTIRPVQGQSPVTLPGSASPTPTNRPVAVTTQMSGNPSPFIYPGLHPVQIDPRLKPEYCFDNFVSGECNKMGIAAGETISAAPGKNPFNPLFLFGGPGLGKTHLAQAIGIAIKERFPDLIVLYVTGNEFKTQYMDAVNIHNKLTDFLAFYMKIDVLIVDDIQDLIGQGSQNAFFNVFNHLHQNCKQLILTSDRSPAELKNFEERLLSRFKWGLPVQLSHPDYNTRLNMLRLRASREGADVPEEVLEYLASRVKKNFRELEGLLISVILYSTVQKNKAMIDIARELSQNVIGEEDSVISIETIRRTVCDYFNISKDDFLSKSRKRQIVQSRQIAMFLSRNLIANSSLAAIGSELGGKDHATVLHACNTVADLMSTDKVFKKYVSDIESMLVAAE